MNSIKFEQNLAQIFQVMYKASLGSLKAGDILQGRVQSLNNGMLLLSLMDGSSFTARVPDGFTASLGEIITLEIGERINDQLTAKLLNNTSSSNQVKASDQPLIELIAKNLESIDIEQSEGLIDGVLKFLGSNPDIPVDNATFLVANGLENNPTMSRIIDMISQHEFNLYHNLQSLKEGLAHIIHYMDGTDKEYILNSLVTYKGLDNLSEEMKMLFSKKGIDIDSKSKLSIINKVKEILTKILLSEISASGEGEIPLQKGLEGLVRDMFSGLKSNWQEGKLDKESSINEPHRAGIIIDVINKILQEIHDQKNGISKSEPDLVRLLDEFFDRAMIEFEDGEAKTPDIREKAHILKEIMDFSQNVLNRANAQYRDQSMPVFQQIDDAFKFFSQVTTYDSIIQIPLRINDERTTGDLYIMKRKKGHRKLDPENFTLFLSLDTQSLGHLESFLNASHKYVTISFCVENEELSDFIKKNRAFLYEGLLRKGYKLAEMKCRIADGKKTSILDAPVRAKEFLGLKASLDLRI